MLAGRDSPCGELASQANHRGIHLGVFAVANALAHHGKLSSVEDQHWRSVNRWYTQRLHSTLDYRTPVEFEELY